MHLRRASLSDPHLLWFNPATRAEQWLIRAPANEIGVTVAIPFYSREDGNL
jgi:hypothetical protein